MPLSNVNYHVIELHRSGLLELASERPVRGATEHFYTLPEALPKVEAEAATVGEPVHA